MRNFVISQPVKSGCRRGKRVLSSLVRRGWVPGMVVLLGACGKHDDPPPATPPTNGVSWTADNTSYTSSSATVTDDGFLMTISGVAPTPTGQNIVRLGVPLAVGTYTAPTTSYPAYYYTGYLVYTGGNAVAYLASNAGGMATGTVTVTTLSATEVAGTFSFTGELTSGAATKAVTSGRFNVKR